jgi:hypothetical protein
MKRCPNCNRTFPDDNQKFCTVDGGLLVAADKPFDPNATIQGSANLAVPLEAPPPKPVSNQPPPDFGATIATPSSAPTVVLPKKTGPTGAPTASNLQPPPPPTTPASAPLPPTPSAPLPSPPSPTVPLASQQQVPSAPLPQSPSAPLPPTPTAGLPPRPSAPLPQAPSVAAPPPAKKSKLPLILGILAILLVLGIAGVVAAFFLVVKPRLEQLNSNRSVVVVENANENTNSNTNANTNTSTNTNQPTPEPEKTQPEFVAPPDTTKFTNSSASLDGKLAEHYFDFSFYYPNGWTFDPKAGKSGATNFAKVEETQEDSTGVYLLQNATISWYNSNGSFEADTSVFPERVKSLEAQLAKGFPGFEKVSEGETKVNSLPAYEFRFKGTFKNTGKGDLPYWGRVIFIPTGGGATTGAVVSLLATSLSSDVSGAEDLGKKGAMSVILDSFRFGKSP